MAAAASALPRRGARGCIVPRSCRSSSPWWHKPKPWLSGPAEGTSWPNSHRYGMLMFVRNSSNSVNVNSNRNNNPKANKTTNNTQQQPPTTAGDAETQSHNTETQKHRDTATQRYRNTETKQHRERETQLSAEHLHNMTPAKCSYLCTGRGGDPHPPSRPSPCKTNGCTPLDLCSKWFTHAGTTTSTPKTTTNAFAKPLLS